MKKVLTTLLLAALPAVAAPAPSYAPDTIERNKAVTRRVFDEILSKGKWEVYAEIFAKDFVAHGYSRTYTLADDMAAAKANRAGSSDSVVTVDQMVAEGDKVAIYWRFQGTHDGAWGGIPASGKKLHGVGMTIYRLVDGRIVEEWSSWDMLGLLEQDGLFRALYFMAVGETGRYLPLLAAIAVAAVVWLCLVRRRRSRAATSGPPN
jgi:steroid delta-isomerase-like uncharacterized protein